ncbi:MAG: shikimate dehydrogenase, partial [Clostridiales bacterium]|nr:shikimate dehydrogenase [Clostridiales bacterium]
MQYGLIGEHLGHSYSREIHEQLADYRYELHELSPDALGPFLTARDFRAINVTIPYKQAVLPYLDEISATARRIGAVNTIVNRGGLLYGDNTDFAGLKALLERLGLCLQGKKVLILGTGCTSKTARAVAEAMGGEEILRVSRRTGEADTVTYAQALAAHTD